MPHLAPRSESARGINTLLREDRRVHDWYRFVLSYPPHLVRQYCEAFGLTDESLLLDPFCGTGTTLVEAKFQGIRSVGCDAHPFAALVSRVKTNWQLGVEQLHECGKRILTDAEKNVRANSLDRISFTSSMINELPKILNDLTADERKILPEGFLSERPLQRLLILRKAIFDSTQGRPRQEREFFLLALGHVIANGAGNFAFGPEIYRTKAKEDYDVLGHYARQLALMENDIADVQKRGLATVESCVIEQDARQLKGLPNEIDAVITSPPYPNEKDYTRTTRVESLILGLISDKKSLRRIKESLLRSNTRNIFVDDRDSDEVRAFDSIERVCQQIEARRVELSKTSGFERLYHKVVSHYFGGMRRHFRTLKPRLRSGARLAYVVGDQLSFLMVHVPTAALLGEVAEAEGFTIDGCDLWRERVGTKVRNDIEGRRTVRVREEVLLLRNP